MPDSQAIPAKAGRAAGRRAGKDRAVDRGLVRPAGDEAHATSIQLVAVGASAGGLEACKALLDALPATTGMAFILVQHLDPTHASLLVELLSTHTTMPVLQATDGMAIARDHLYVIPPAMILTVGGGLLHLSRAPARHGARLPFDALLLSMAASHGPNATCIVLSGTGADGSAGLLAIKRQGGFVLVQEPSEAGHDGMPRSAIATGEVDAVLPVAAMPAALAERPPHAARPASPPPASPPASPTGSPPASPSDSPTALAAELRDDLPEIIELLRTRTSHDFTLYKPGTLKRRAERRMAMAGIDAMDGYAELLRNDPAELERLAKDLLIHVTSFFRDLPVFEQLADTIVPEIVGNHEGDQPIRIWVAGCSRGEEAYSLAMLFHEQIGRTGSAAKLQVFASDADAEAVAAARDGFYPAGIEADVTPARLAAFFVKEDQGYRVLPELRAMVVFTVQDLLADPPFSRLDIVSCRNVMIYLGAEAQRKVIALFHFALRRGGILLLGNAESVGDAASRFEVVSKANRLYRHIGRNRPGDVDFAKHAGEALRKAGPAARLLPPSRQAALAALCQRQTLLTHAPATVLVTREREYLFSLGPTERHLRVAPGHVTTDVLSMVADDVRTRLRAAILRATQENAPVVVSGGAGTKGAVSTLTLEVHPVRHDGEDLLLIHFIDRPAMEPDTAGQGAPERSRVAELERELKNTQDELQGAVQSLELSSEEQKSINENALSINEEFQSTNEELLTSKEELQSLNEELTALNSQLQETLEQQRTTSNDLQNVLYSTDVATLFLDAELCIRFFTPATKALFNVIKTDIGRPLADLHSLAADTALAADARAVLETAAPVEHEIETPAGVWCRRILPYKTHDGTVEGVVITFTDITGRKLAAEALDVARREAEQANAAKSHFLAAASHDLRQPLQTLALLLGLLANRVEGTVAQKLVARLEDTVGAMSGMLNTLLDINQIDTGVVSVERVDFAIDDVLRDLKGAFAYQAQAQGLELRVVPSGLVVHTDPSLLEQMLRNLVSNALKFTKAGKVLLGCRRSGELARIEVWDTGIGIPDTELANIFEEYRQLDNAARERSRGLGLGLSIVSRLGTLLGHRVAVRSRPGKGSVFSVEVPLIRRGLPPPHCSAAVEGAPAEGAAARRTGTVLVVEDDADVRELLALILSDGGHRAAIVPDGPAAMAMVERGAVLPDLLLTDYTLPNSMDGLAVAAALRMTLGAELPVIVLTGDISTRALGAIAAQRCLQLNKPVKPAELSQAIQALLPVSRVRLPARPSPGEASATVFLIDDDRNIRETVRILLEDNGRTVLDFATGEAFLAAYTPGVEGCLLVDATLPGMGGLDLLRRLRAGGDRLPAIVITGRSNVPMAVRAMKAGAADFIEKPIAAADLLASIDRALERSRDRGKQRAWQASAAEHIAGLTPRQREVMDLVLAGHPSKNIAADLRISQRTVENHRASIMKATGTRSLPSLARLAMAAAGEGAAE